MAILAACAGFNPSPDSSGTWQDRALSDAQGEISVRVSVLGAAESELMFDADLYSAGIQPVWIEVQNSGTERAWYLPVGTDEEYFVPHEVAWKFRGGRTGPARTEMEAWLRDSAMSRIIPAGETVSGFVFSHLESGTRGVNVDIIDDEMQLRSFTFFVDVPGMRADHRDIVPQDLYSDMGEEDTSGLDGLVRALGSLPCCSSEPSKDLPDFVLNLVIVADTPTFHSALIRGRWEEAPIIGLTEDSVGADYLRYADARPVEPMYLYGRVQDAVFRKTRPSVGESNQLNLWLSPVKYRGIPVWLAQTARTISARQGDRVLTEPHLDEARFYFIQNLLYSGSVEAYGFLPAIPAISYEDYESATDGTEYFTDGQRLVLWLSESRVPYDEIEYRELGDGVGR